MSIRRKICCVETHTAGEPTRVVVGLLPMLRGRTILEKRDYLKKNFDNIRRTLMHEPRGHKEMFGSIILPPSNPKADLGVIFMHSGGYVDMCVHGSIGTVTVAVETGMIDPKGAVTNVVLETPAGLVPTCAHVEKSSVRSVRVRNVPAFLFKSSEIDLPQKKGIPLDIAFGGNFFAIVDAKSLGVRVSTASYEQLVTLGLSLRDEVNAQFEVQHPEQKHIRSVDLVEICDMPTHPNAHVKNATIFGRGQVDRSPCGTGTCAKMATLYAKGELELGKEFVSESILGTLFKGKLLGETRVGIFRAVSPEIEGTAHITGFSQFVQDPSDPLREGFLLR